MSRPTVKTATLAKAVALVVLVGTRAGSHAEQNPAEAKIERATSAGPPEIARSAKIIDKDAQGHAVVLREGSNGFTCMPGNPNVIGDPPMCADQPSMQWAADFAARKPKPPTPFQGSRTCSRVLLSAAISIRMTRPARQSPSAHTG